MRRTGLLALAAFVPFVALAACGGDADGDDEVVVFAAASLTDAFTDIGAAYTTETGVAVTTSFAGSSDLARQIAEGAPADVFASADLANMAKVAEAAPDAVVFATNRAEIVVEAGNPHGVADLADLADPDLLVVVCAVEVPCGAYTAEILDRSGVALTPASYESNVKAVVTKVALGEADAGIVYATDVAAAGDTVEGVAIDAVANVTAEYPIAALDGTGERFVEFVRGDEAQRILREYGFGAP